VELPIGRIRISTDDEPRCDGNGNLLLPSNGTYEPSGLVRVSQGGDLLADILPSSIPGFESSEIADFANGPDDETYVLVQKVLYSRLDHDTNGKTTGAYHELDFGYWLLIFGPDGKFISQAKFNFPREIITFAIFPNGNVFIVGLTETDKSYGGIFTRSGDLIKRVSLPDNLTRKEHKGENEGLARDGVRLRVADDGNAYLITGRYFPRVSVFSSSGSLLSTAPIALPRDIEDMWMEQFSHGTLAAELVNRKAFRRMIALFDTGTGKMLNKYDESVPDDWLVCYGADKDRFTFVPNGGSVVRQFVGRK
jgi:hypothetical protein